MTYHVAAWINNGSVIAVETDTLPITENHMPDYVCDYIIRAEVSGDYIEADKAHAAVSMDGDNLVGLDFVSQEKIEGTPGPTLEELRERATLSRMAFMLALDDMGELEAVQAADLPKRARIMFDNASEFERMHPELLNLAAEMGYTDEQLDALFGIEVTE